MDKNTWLGFLLIAAIIIGFSMLNRPSKEELAEQQRIQDSIAVAQAQEAEAQRVSQELTAQLEQSTNNATPISQDSLQVQLQAVYGTFAQAAQGTEQLVTVENEVLRLTLSTHGGVIKRAELLDYRANGDTINPLSPSAEMSHLWRSHSSQPIIVFYKPLISTSHLLSPTTIRK
jgi:YidC/Oxa1 family membrane protein insertase